MKRALAYFIIILTTVTTCLCQSIEITLGGSKQLVQEEKVPETITSERSVVLVQTALNRNGDFQIKRDWKPTMRLFQKGFQKIGVDAVYALHLADLNAGPEVSGSFSTVLNGRSVKNLIVIEILQDGSYQLLATKYNEKEDLVNDGDPCWITRSGNIKTVLLRLGRQVLRQELPRTNFLIPEEPEYLGEFDLIKGTRYANFSSRLKSQKLAVIKFDGVPPTSRNENLSYQNQIDKLNSQLVEIMKTYPFKYEIVPYQKSEELYAQGYQYALFPLTNTARKVREMLEYKTSDQETEFVSLVEDNAEKRVLRVPANAMVTKYYLKQTIVNDIHVGNEWDADITWDESLKHFIFHLKKAFRISN